MTRITIGLTARVVVFGDKNKKEIIARIDTGATNSSIDATLAKELGLQGVKHTKVKSAHGTRYRPVVMAEALISGELIPTEFTVADRAHMKYRVLIGQNILKKGKFLIDPLKP